MLWKVLDIIGTSAFAMSGAVVAIESNYDIFGIVLLAFTTAFGGSAVRNALIGLPVSSLWNEQHLIQISLITALIVFIFPVKWFRSHTSVLTIFDAIGLSAFAVQSAAYTASLHHSLTQIIFAATLSGVGGGMIRDVLAGRQPLVLHRNEYYALWAVLAGIIVGITHAMHSNLLYALFIFIAGMRILSVQKNWQVPRHLWLDHDSFSD
ncbi:MAG: trimeric intracellular cation channel family protein [Firmicutes bacterium]|nr:trimeric intracellular cation channel family protein [Bacillota bacterium]